MPILAAAWVGALLAPGLTYAQAIGTEFQVNTTTSMNQREADVAVDGDGNFIVVFQNHLPTTNANVSARRFSRDGQPIGDEFQVNTTSFSDVTLPAVAMAPDGRFVVVWQDFGDDGSGFGIFARRYAANGSAQGANFLVNTTTDDAQRRADVAMDDDGNFVIVWEDDTAGNEKRGIRGRRYNAVGGAQGGEFDVSTNADIDHTYPKVAMDGDGNFVVGWSSGNVGANQNVVFRRFQANGTAIGLPVQVNVTSRMEHASGVVNNMAIGSDASGNFIVAWAADNFSGPGVPGQSIGILARGYDSTGTPLGNAFEVNTANPSGAPEVAVTANGTFAIAFEAPDGSLSGVSARFYDSDGQALGPAVRFNTTTQLGQERPSIALDEEGRGVIVWRARNNQDGDADGVFARLLRYDSGALGGNRVLRILCLVDEQCKK
ncbi:MAG: hypothetical protein RIC56_23860 [Pseudomonadales bacterium]